VNARVERLRGELERLGAATFLVSHPINVRYLSGFESSNAALLVDRDRVVLLTDGRYIEASRGVPGVEAVHAERDLFTYLGETLATLAPPPVAFESDHVTVAAHAAVAASGVELVPAAKVVKTLRAVKEEVELEAIRRSARVLTDAFARLAREPFSGRTEAELAWWMERAIRDEGADDVSFDVIVASGPNAALPHHHPGPRAVVPGETVIVDAGAKVGGYCSDCTRTFATGPLPDDLVRAYATCRAAQESSLAAVRAGVSTRDVDAIARREIDESGIAPVLHNLGHGVGLEIHELPVFSNVSDETLAPGNAMTVEPGVYLPDLGIGVRIEDEVLVTEKGCEVLTRSIPRSVAEIESLLSR
jgi:Xaa-Pro aminopeptidase